MSSLTSSGTQVEEEKEYDRQHGGGSTCPAGKDIEIAVGGY
jgi:hypothetical protein